MFDHLVILTVEPFKPVIYHMMEKYCEGTRYNFIFGKKELEDVMKDVSKDSLLLSLGTGVIVPQDFLNKFGAAYNFHPAPATYPGMHPHHFAALNKERVYGAVVHEMTSKVDSGPVVITATCEMPENAPWTVYLDKALEQSFELMDSFFRTIFLEKIIPLPCGVSWGDKMYTQKDFIESGGDVN